MSYEIHSSLLHGVPYNVAECYGKPHFLCEYTGSGVNGTRLFDGARCMTCGRMATNAHHWPPKRTASTFTRNDGITLRPALFAVCGHGTTGCHDGWHGGARFRALWLWDSDEYARRWWESNWPDEIGHHSSELYLYGCWEVYDLRNGLIWQVHE